jgi:2-keto-3-deoxy-L-rhamnonate aldolase RhmA
MVVLMIESREGLDHVEEIASLEGLDALFIGPYDLTLSLGLIEQFDSPVFWAAVDRVFAAARMAGIAAGLTSTDISILQEARKRGGRFLLYASDIAVLLAGYKRAIGELKQVEDGATHTA